MQQSYQDDVGQPDAPAIHHSSVGVDFAVCHPHIHPIIVREQAGVHLNFLLSFFEFVPPYCLLKSPNTLNYIGNERTSPSRTKEKLKTWGKNLKRQEEDSTS